MKTVKVVFTGGGPQDGAEKTLQEPLKEHIFFPRITSAPVVIGLTTLPASAPVGRYVYLLCPFPDGRGRHYYEYEGEC